MGKWTSRVAFLGIAGVLTLIVAITRGEADNPFPRSSPIAKASLKPAASVAAAPVPCRPTSDRVRGLPPASGDLACRATDGDETGPAEDTGIAFDAAEQNPFGATFRQNPPPEPMPAGPNFKFTPDHSQRSLSQLVKENAEYLVNVLQNAPQEQKAPKEIDLEKALMRYFAADRMTDALSSLEAIVKGAPGSPEAHRAEAALQILRGDVSPPSADAIFPNAKTIKPVLPSVVPAN